MAEQARKNLKEIEALQALSLDDLPEGGLDSLWSRLKTVMADRPDPSQAKENDSDRRADAKAVLQKAEQDAAQATNAVFDKMRTETDEELAGARKIKAATIQAREKAEAAVAEANEYKTLARQQADEMLTEASGRVETMLLEAQEKIRQIASDAEDNGKKRVAEAETQAQEIIAEAQAKSDEVAVQVQSVVDRDVEGLKLEAIEEIKMVRDSIAQLHAELEEELETQRILTDAARLSMVSEAVGAGAFAAKATAAHAATTNGRQNGAASESDEDSLAHDTSLVEAENPEISDQPQARQRSSEPKSIA